MAESAHLSTACPPDAAQRAEKKQTNHRGKNPPNLLANNVLCRIQSHFNLMEKFVLLYHEKQEAALCGVHCLNTLLQGPLFGAIELAQIAQELDALERNFMSESGIDSEDYKKFIEEDSGNVSSDGFFSIQVLSKALQIFGLTSINLDNPEVAQSAAHPELEEAFICNLREHWFTLRKIAGEWWDFNSMHSAPKPLSHTYMSLYLAQLREEGYSIFVVQGALPSVTQDDGSVSGDAPGAWYTPEQARTASLESSGARQKGYLKAAYHGAFAQATQEGRMVTLQPQQDTRSRSRSQSWDEDEDLAKAIAASLEGKHDASMPAPECLAPEPASVTDTAQIGLPPPPDPGEEPDAGPGVIELALRLPNGKRLMRRFNSSQPVSDVQGFVRYSCPEVGPSPVLIAQMPRRVLHDVRQKLRDAGLANREALTVHASSQ